jgi:hypothetical protein
VSGLESRGRPGNNTGMAVVSVRTDWRRWAGSAAGVLVVVVALALPLPQAPPAPSIQDAPVRLSAVWPGAKPYPVPAEVSGGIALRPLLVVDPDTMVALVSRADQTSGALVIRTGRGTVRTLRTWTGQPLNTVAAVVVADTEVLWLELSTGDSGGGLVTLWHAPLSQPADPVPLATEPGDLLYYDSGYDLQVVDGTVYWAALGADGGGEVHSVPLTGGPVRIRRLDKPYALTTWPWVTSSGASRAGDVDLLNLETGERRTVPGGANEVLNCTVSWCRVTTLIDQGQDLLFEVERPDGSDRRKTGSTALTPVNTDVALMDRFEVLASAVTDSGYGQNLWLYDLTAGRQVLLDPAATSSPYSRGPYLWWSTGDNETAVWHILDLRQLG